MAVEINKTRTYQSGLGGYLQSHTFPDVDADGFNNYVLAFGIHRLAADVTSWTIEGVAPTAVGSRIVNFVAGVDARGRVIGGTGITNVIGTSGFNLMAGIVASFTGVDQTTPTATPVGSDQGYGTTASVSYTGEVGSLLAVMVSTQEDRTMSPLNCTTATQVTNTDPEQGSGFLGYIPATGSPQTVGATWTGDTVWAIVVAEIKAAPDLGVQSYERQDITIQQEARIPITIQQGAPVGVTATQESRVGVTITQEPKVSL